MSSDYLFDKDGEPDAEVRALEETLRPVGYRSHSFRPRNVSATSRRTMWRFAIAAAVLLAASGGAVWLTRSMAPSFEVIRTHEASVRSTRLWEGAWLETAGAETAQVKVADVGELTLAPGSKLRLLHTGAAEHRMELARGSFTAKVDAPPRLFVVETPSAVAVDLGCAYTLAVLSDNSTRLEVTAGQVELQGRGKRSFVPFGAEARSFPGKGPGLPISLKASASFRAAVDGLSDIRPTEIQLKNLVALAEPLDAVTLFNLLPLVDAKQRHLLLQGIGKFVSLPAGIDPDSTSEFDSAPMLALWKRTLAARETIEP